LELRFPLRPQKFDRLLGSTSFPLHHTANVIVVLEVLSLEILESQSREVDNENILNMFCLPTSSDNRWENLNLDLAPPLGDIGYKPWQGSGVPRSEQNPASLDERFALEVFQMRLPWQERPPKHRCDTWGPVITIGFGRLALGMVPWSLGQIWYCVTASKKCGTARMGYLSVLQVMRSACSIAALFTLLHCTFKHECMAMYVSSMLRCNAMM
jgi:hypothetical protein